MRIKWCRGAEDADGTVQKFKAEHRKKLMLEGYRIWGVVGDQWSSINGLPTGKRTFKLPNSLYMSLDKLIRLFKYKKISSDISLIVHLNLASIPEFHTDKARFRQALIPKSNFTSSN